MNGKVEKASEGIILILICCADRVQPLRAASIDLFFDSDRFSLFNYFHELYMFSLYELGSKIKELR